MKSKWKATVSNPLGKEIYDMIVDTIDNVTSANIVNEKGSVVLSQLNATEPLILSSLVETPMRTKIVLQFLTDNYQNQQQFNAILSIGEFATMSVECVKYE
jgi:hypothetical protein